MRIVRLIAALVMAAGLALLPVSSFARMAHAAKAEMAMTTSGDDCPCCARAMPEACPLVCCHLSALAVEDWAVPRHLADRLFGGETNVLIAFLPRPDPPPPRSWSPSI